MMNLVDWWKKHRAERLALADSIGTSIVVMRQIVYGHRTAGPARAIAIEESISALTPSDLVSRSEIRPDIWTTPQQQ